MDTPIEPANRNGTLVGTDIPFVDCELNTVPIEKPRNLTTTFRPPERPKSLMALCESAQMMEDLPEISCQAADTISSGRKRRTPPGPGLKWCAGGSGGGGRWVDDATPDEINTGSAEKNSISTKRSKLDEVSVIASRNVGSNRPKNRSIGNGIFISGGRVLMNDSNAPVEDKITVCMFCHRTFVSAHALDVHLSRNQVICIGRYLSWTRNNIVY